MINIKSLITSLLLFLFFLCSVECHAKKTENVVVDSLSFRELTDITARRMPEYDRFGNPCALVKVYAPLMENIKFSGERVVKVSHVDDCIWLWMQDGSSYVVIEAKNMQPMQIDFVKFGYPGLHAKTTYQLNITIGHETERIIYKEVETINNVYKTKYIDPHKFDKNKIYWFLTYQIQSGSPLGLNIGLCEEFGFYLACSGYYGEFLDFQPTEEKPYEMYTVMGGSMFRLTPYLYLQTGLGCSYEPNVNTYFTCGANLQFRYSIFVIGVGYNFNYMSVAYKRNIILDGLTAQVGFSF